MYVPIEFLQFSLLPVWLKSEVLTEETLDILQVCEVQQLVEELHFSTL